VYYSKLLQVLLQKIAYPSASFTSWEEGLFYPFYSILTSCKDTSDIDSEDFDEYRENVMSVFMSVLYVLGTESYLSLLLSALRNYNSLNNWHYFEAVYITLLYAI
jgi:hypothetical protein